MRVLFIIKLKEIYYQSKNKIGVFFSITAVQIFGGGASAAPSAIVLEERELGGAIGAIVLEGRELAGQTQQQHMQPAVALRARQQHRMLMRQGAGRRARRRHIPRARSSGKRGRGGA